MRGIVLLALGFLVAAAVPGAATCGPLLNELMADPNSDWDGNGVYHSRDDEWVEIVNPGPGVLDLTGYYIGDASGGFVYGFTGTLPPGGVRVVYGSDSVLWESQNGQTQTGLRLNNTGDTCTLWQVIGEEKILIDAYTYTNLEAEDDRSSGRWPDGGPEWKLFDGLNPYSGSTPPFGTGLMPTPGTSNHGGDTPNALEDVSWSRVKALYSQP